VFQKCIFLKSSFSIIFNVDIIFDFLDKDLYKLHSSLQHLKIPDDIWVPLSDAEKKVLKSNLLAEDVVQVIEDPDSTLPVSAELIFYK